MTLDISMILGGFGALTAVIGYLWREHINDKKAVETKLEKCESSHVESVKSTLELTREVGELKGRQEGVNSLARQVLEMIAEGKKNA